MEKRPFKKPRPYYSRNVHLADYFQGVNHRAGPGQLPQERHGKTFNMPFSELTASQRAAAREILGVEDEYDWEVAMPRRLYGYSTSTVVSFQTKTWSQLSPEHQELALKEFSIDETFWNSKLAIFHDDLWNIPEITLTKREFAPVLATIKKMGKNPTMKKQDVAKFLFSLERVLLPSQAVNIANTLKASSSWESLQSLDGRPWDPHRTPNNPCFARFHIHLVIVSFLTYPKRFARLPAQKIQSFWNDGTPDGCLWAENFPWYLNQASLKKPPYRDLLLQIPVRRCVSSILTGSLPERMKEASKLPDLPQSVVKYILNDMLGTRGGAVDPAQVAWIEGQLSPPVLTYLKAEPNQQEISSSGN